MSDDDNITPFHNENTGIIGSVASALGTNEAALKLLLSLLFGYPLAYVYHKYVKDNAVEVRHIFFALTGFAMCIFNYGFDVYHSILAVSITYILCRFFYKLKYFVVINFVFNMGYLLIGYYYTESNDYDIKWTMPHCVLVLRLIGFGYDVADGQVDKSKLSKDQLENHLDKMPSALELAAFAYFPASFLVGPQFPFRRYQNFINKKYEMHKGNIEAGLKRGGLGILYLIIRQIGAAIYPDSYLLTPEFAAVSFFKKIFTIGVWGKISLYKYISCWLITEGALMCFGLTYVDTNKDTGVSDWSGCSNVRIRLFELATKMDTYVKAFNVNTNQWVASYVYKRLRFLGNRTISYASALFFLAMWHGFHSGYYMSFILEYIVITFEKQFFSLWSRYVLPKYSNILDSPFGEISVFILMRIYNIICMGWCLVPFVFLSCSRWWQIYSSLYHYGYVFLIVWFIFYFYMQSQIKPKKKSNNEQNTNVSTTDKPKVQ